MSSKELDYQPEGDDQEQVTERISLNDYINDNANLFLVMGVFAALSVYISRIPSEQVTSESIRLGLVSSLLITTLLGGVVLFNLRDQVSEDGDLLENLFHLKNIDTIAFISLFLTLFFSLYRIITGETRSLAVVSIIVIAAATVTIFITLIEVISHKLTPYISYAPLRTSVVGIFINGFSYLGMRRTINHLERNYQAVPFQEMQEATFTETLPTIVHLICSVGQQVVLGFLILSASVFVFASIDIVKMSYYDRNSE